MDWKKESEMFDCAAEYYDKFRPGYPAGVAEKIVTAAKLDVNSRILEIGSGSGKATAMLAPYGFGILCVDPGERLVEKGRKNYSEFVNVSFEVGRFEEMDLPEKYFDAVFSAQAFHWIPQPEGYGKCARILKDNGYLALLWNMYITYDSDEDYELLEISGRYGGFADFLSEADCERRISSVISGIESGGYFDSPSVHRILWSRDYTVGEYCGFVQTGNRFMQKTDVERNEAFEAIREFAGKHGGIIRRPYLCVLYLAEKKIKHRKT